MNNHTLPIKNKEEQQGFDYKRFVARILVNLPLFIISLIVFGVAGYLYKRYATPNYKIGAMIIVEPDSKSGGGSGAMSALGGSGLSSLTDVSSLFGIPNNAENEVQILQSRSIITDVVKALKLNVTVYRNGKIKKTELFNEAPFDINITYKTDSIANQIYEVSVSKDSIHFKNKKDNINVKAAFGQKISLPQYDLVFTPRHHPIEHLGYSIKITSEESAVEALMKAIDVSLSSKTTTTIDLSLDYPNSKKGEAILNTMMGIYLRANKENKVEIADSTLAFIDGRLAMVGTQLSGIEKNFENFRKENKIADADEQSKALIGASSDFQKQLSTIEVQISVIQDIKKFLEDPKNKKIIPAEALGSDNQGFSDVVEKYNELLLERDHMSMASTDKNPYVQDLDTQIDNLRGILLNNINSYLKGLDVAKTNLEKQNNSFTGKLEKVPTQARTFLDYSRQQTVEQDLYVFLLQTREETAISKTSTISTARIVDRAKSDYEPSKLKINLIAIIFLVIGLVIPFLYLRAKEVLSVRIVSKQEIQNETKIPIVGEICHSPMNDAVVVNDRSRTIISEQFRDLRANLQFLFSDDKPRVILISSSMSGEGKSFISLNIGSALSLSGKKVVFVELDLRKPKLSDDIGVDRQTGFTNYAVSNKFCVDDIIKPTGFNENCYIISSGPIPPNPSELLLSDKLAQLIDQLKRRFDYVIIDSPPVGLVSDPLLIEKYADITLFVVRQKYTYKAQLENLNELMLSKKLRKAYIVINDIEFKKGGYFSRYAYGYGYGYGNGYGYGYSNGQHVYGLEAENQKSSNWFSQLFKSEK